MARGGKRDGAGRKSGAPNKASAARQAEVAATGITPLDWMLGVLRDKTADNERRDKAARDCAPYVHPRLAAVELTGADGGPVRVSIEGDDKGLL